MTTVIRVVLIVIGLAGMVLGIVAMVTNPALAPAALWWVAMGGLLVVAVAAERQRYRSEAAERRNSPAGPGGGETPADAPEGRFRPTTEVFLDPTSGYRMRVLVDPSTGERRYVAEA
jgi:hypothetical protein